MEDIHLETKTAVEEMTSETKNVKKHKYSFEDRNAFLFCYIILGIPFLFFLVFWVYINFNSILLAFQDANGVYTFDNFKTVFNAFKTEDMYGFNLTAILGRTVLLWFLVDIVCVIPSMLSSYVLYKKIPGASIFRVILMVPSILAGIVWVMVMKRMVHITGPVMTILKNLGVTLSPEVLELGLLRSSETAFITLVIINIFPHLVSLNLIISGAYSKIPTELFEVGRLEGLSFIREFFKVAVPLVWPTIVISMITNLATIFTFEGGVFLYTMGKADTATMGFYIYYMTYQIAGSADVMTPFYGYPAAVGVTLTAITVPAVLIGKYVLERLVEPVEF